MNLDFNKILADIQKNLSCPVCKRKFTVSEIKFKYVLENLILFTVFCSNKHVPVKIVNLLVVDRTLRKETSFLEEKNMPKIYKQIDNFNGDFIRLWKK